MSTIIEVQNIHKSYGNVEVLRGVDLSVDRGEIVSIVGASGAGKTTLLQIIGTLATATRGDVIIDGTNINKMKDAELSAFRNRNIGFVFQFHNLLAEFSARENIAIPAMIGGVPRIQALQRADELAAMMGLTHRLEHKPSQMSGGEQQRVAIARALINNPTVVLADEPSGNLDSHNREEIHKLFFDLRDKLGLTMIIVTHDTGLAAQTDRCVQMVDGMIVNG